MGNASRGLLRGPGLSTWDVSLNKDTVMPFYGEVPFAWFTKRYKKGRHWWWTLGERLATITNPPTHIRIGIQDRRSGRDWGKQE